jgi:hypothetical protein
VADKQNCLFSFGGIGFLGIEVLTVMCHVSRKQCKELLLLPKVRPLSWQEMPGNSSAEITSLDTSGVPETNRVSLITDLEFLLKEITFGALMTGFMQKKH